MIQAHEIDRRSVDASRTRPHELNQRIATISVHLWCLCGRHVQGTRKLALDKIDDDIAMLEAIADAEAIATQAFKTHSGISV